MPVFQNDHARTNHAGRAGSRSAAGLSGSSVASPLFRMPHCRLRRPTHDRHVLFFDVFIANSRSEILSLSIASMRSASFNLVFVLIELEVAIAIRNVEHKLHWLCVDSRAMLHDDRLLPRLAGLAGVSRGRSRLGIGRRELDALIHRHQRHTPLHVKDHSTEERSWSGS